MVFIVNQRSLYLSGTFNYLLPKLLYIDKVKTKRYLLLHVQSHRPVVLK